MSRNKEKYKENLTVVKSGLFSKTSLRILALGAQTKATFVFLKKGGLFLSPSYADLGNPEAFSAYRAHIYKLIRSASCRPQLLACDLHPDYQSSCLGAELSDAFGIPLARVQHHKAHIASVMVEYSLRAPLLGIAFDGTGLGQDSNLWGAEMFYVTPCDFRRVAQLRYIPLVGGEKAVWEVWRLAAAWLDATYGRRFLRLSIPFVKRLDKKKWHIMEGMMNKRVNCPLSSSMGRLFDAVAVLSGAAPFVISQEAEAAMALERQARAFRGKKSAYPFSLKKERDGSLLIDPRPLLRKIIEDIRRGASPEGIAANFHVSIAHMVARVVSELRKMYDFQTVIFSGGVFQNQLLKELLGREFSSLKCRLYWPLTIPAHDGGISVGQAFLAQETTRKV